MPSPGRATPVGDVDVGRGEPELGAPPAVAVDDHAPDLVGPAEQAAAPRTSPSASSPRMRVEETASPGRVRLESQAHDLESVACAHLGQQRHVAFAAVAEMEVLPHHHQPGAEGLDQDLDDEVLGRLVGPGLVEGHDDGAVEPGGGEELELLLEVGEEQAGPTRGGPRWPGGGRRSPRRSSDPRAAAMAPELDQR